jgi:hypothetical protein
VGLSAHARARQAGLLRLPLERDRLALVQQRRARPWLVQSDVDGGRSALNFSEWNRPQDVDLDEIDEAIRSGSMPPWFYRVPHPAARLSPAEKDALIRGLDETFARSAPPGGSESDD